MPKLWLGFHNPTYVDIEETVSMQVNKEGNLFVVQLKGKSRPVFIELTVENEAHLIREAVSKLDDSIFTNYRQKKIRSHVMPIAQEARLPTLAAIHRSPYAGRQIKEASLSLMFNGLYRAPNKAWQTTLWFATGQKLATQEEAFDMDWGGYM